ncbi:hypothetical protein EJB05_14543 [Eragrostis curvula]|uniref:F-box domain-containing protein n=1 Tax=Eragrostis curvula TaxID=38414 RepID=A0A5J9VZE3_9POAL|nr:hypothetical protein EJB05_14543 [Eragrostis curvula]
MERPRLRRAREAAIDRISALPDGVLEHILGFLPADKAVQTSVLARRWRHLWRYTRRLSIIFSGRRRSADGFKKLMSGLLLLRNTAVALDEVEFSDTPLQKDDGTYINIWIRHVLSCQAKKLLIRSYIGAKLDGLPLISQHLQKLEFWCVGLGRNFLDFASCPLLQVLEITGGYILCERILSQSIKHLTIKFTSFSCEVRTRISIPSLVLMKLDFYVGKTPLLHTMPLLQTALVEPAFSAAEDYCDKGDSKECCGICANCCGEDIHSSGSMLLGGLSSAMNLELIALRGTIIFRRDLRWCPTFHNLKTLFLNEWCVANGPGALLCILEHSPVLEKLTLKLAKGPNHRREMDAVNNVMEKSSAISKHLKMVYVQCEVVDDRNGRLEEVMRHQPASSAMSLQSDAVFGIVQNR